MFMWVLRIQTRVLGLMWQHLADWDVFSRQVSDYSRQLNSLTAEYFLTDKSAKSTKWDRWDNCLLFSLCIEFWVITIKNVRFLVLSQSYIFFYFFLCLHVYSYAYIGVLSICMRKTEVNFRCCYSVYVQFVYETEFLMTLELTIKLRWLVSET